MSLLDHVKPIPPDPIFGLGEQFMQDKNPNKIDLTVGLYYNENLENRTMRSIAHAERKLLEAEKNKTYSPIGGHHDFLEISRRLVFGASLSTQEKKRFISVQGIGGTGALRIGADLISREISKTVYISDPTWPNHLGVFSAVNMEIKKYPYYNRKDHNLAFGPLLDMLAKAPKKSIVVLHNCCHNPTGCDPDQNQWKELSSLMLKRMLIPFFDIAYLGFGQGIEKDPWPIRYFSEAGHELFVAHSFSKTFGLYGERVGALHMLVKNRNVAEIGQTVFKRIVRTSISNPPIHGAALVAIVMQDEKLKKMWQEEIDDMRLRVQEMRSELSDAFKQEFGTDKFCFLKNHFGLFSTLDLGNEEIEHLIRDYGIYLTKNGRINLTGLNKKNISRFVRAIIKVTR